MFVICLSFGRVRPVRPKATRDQVLALAALVMPLVVQLLQPGRPASGAEEVPGTWPQPPPPPAGAAAPPEEPAGP